jgi:hypothetical protein
MQANNELLTKLSEAIAKTLANSPEFQTLLTAEPRIIKRGSAKKRPRNERVNDIMLMYARKK